MYTIYNLIAMYNKTLYHLLITKYIHTIYIYTHHQDLEYFHFLV
jgi:hypothetical protein